MRGIVFLRRGLTALALSFAASLVATAAAAQSADPVPILSPVPAAAAAAKTIDPTQPITVEMNEGQLIRLNSAASNIFLANPKVADVTVKSATLVYIFLFPDSNRLLRPYLEHQLKKGTTVVCLGFNLPAWDDRLDGWHDIVDDDGFHRIVYIYKR